MKKFVVMMTAVAMVAGMAMAEEAEKTEAKVEAKVEAKAEAKPEVKLTSVVGVVSVTKDEAGLPTEIKITTADKKEVAVTVDEIGKKVAALDGKTVKVEGTADDKGVMTVVKFEEKKEKKEKKDAAKPAEVKKEAVKETKKTE